MFEKNGGNLLSKHSSGTLRPLIQIHANDSAQRSRQFEDSLPNPSDKIHLMNIPTPMFQQFANNINMTPLIGIMKSCTSIVISRIQINILMIQQYADNTNTTAWSITVIRSQFQTDAYSNKIILFCALN
jgi:hypothetical protein